MSLSSFEECLFTARESVKHMTNTGLDVSHLALGVKRPPLRQRDHLIHVAANCLRARHRGSNLPMAQDLQEAAAPQCRDHTPCNDKRTARNCEVSKFALLFQQ